MDHARRRAWQIANRPSLRLQILSGSQDTRMLDRGNNDTSGPRSSKAEDRHVVRFCPPACEQNLIARHSDGVAAASHQQIFACPLYHLASLSPGGMLAAWVCQPRLIERSHMLCYARVDQCGRVVIEVDCQCFSPQKTSFKEALSRGSMLVHVGRAGVLFRRPKPPSTPIVCPVIQDCKGSRSQQTARAMSSG